MDPRFITEHPDILALLRRRRSTRTFSPAPLGPLEEAVREAVARLPDPPFGHRPRLAVIDARNCGVGSYGLLRDPALFVAGPFPKACRRIEDYGYSVGRVLLEATALGLGSCCLGVSFDRNAMARKLGADYDEFVPCAVALGLPAPRPSLMDCIVRVMSGSRGRKRWGALFKSGPNRAPIDPAEAGPYGPALEAVRMAPSSSNRQPWRVEEREGEYRFFLERSVGVRVDQGWDMQRLDIGIAMCHFELAARATGLEGSWESGLDESGSLLHIATWVDSGRTPRDLSPRDIADLFGDGE